MLGQPPRTLFRWHGRPVFVMYCGGYCALAATTDWTEHLTCPDHPKADVRAETCFIGDRVHINPTMRA